MVTARDDENTEEGLKSAGRVYIVEGRDFIVKQRILPYTY